MDPFERSAQFRARLKGIEAVVVGLGASGISAARLLRRLGARVIGTDAASLEKLSPEARSLTELGVRLAVGGHAEARFEQAEMIVMSPGVPSIPLVEAQAARGAEIIGELELATRLLPKMPAVSITGSNGKSTTTTLVGALLERAGRKPFTGGNLGDPPSDLVAESPAESGGSYSALVLEISSYQAERMPCFKPVAAAFLNASPNHLDRYDGFASYVRAKGNLFVNQTEDDVAVIPVGDPAIAEQAKRGRARRFTFGKGSEGARPDFEVTPSAVIDHLRGFEFARSEIFLAGEHNALNVAAALGLILPFTLARGEIEDTLRAFRGLPHRISFTRELAGVRYYDDSKGTNVGASVAAILGLSEPKVVLIAGGRDKLGSYEPLVDALRARGRGLVLIGEAADRIAEAVGDAAPIERAKSMDEAVARASALAVRGDAVLLSPACSSFDMFKDYKHRGEAFVSAVLALPGV